ncbi:MAG TPA: hypothetical protein VFZ25_15280, partial [Chloroflexota bacterium]|nr:hypothetical protein [Chloroflexota bacterium]
MDAQQVFRDAVEPAARQAMAAYRVSGIVIAAQRGAEPVLTITVGADAAGAPLDGNSLFPVASL